MPLARLSASDKNKKNISKCFSSYFPSIGTWCFIIQREETARSMFSYKKSRLTFRV